MKRFRYPMLLAATLLLATSAPGLCDSGTPSASSSASPPAKTSTNQAASSRLSSLPLAAAGFFAGFVVGTPINFVRYLKLETLDGAHGLLGSIGKDSDKPALLVPAVVCSLPCAVLVTMVEAPVYGFKNAYMAEKPFSKEQFSLGTLEDPSNL